MSKIGAAIVFVAAVGFDMAYYFKTGQHNGWLIFAAIIAFFELS